MADRNPGKKGLLNGWLGNSALRAATIGTKALLVLALAIWLEPAELGLFGLISAIVALTSYLFGLDFYTFVVRDISLADLGDLRRKLRDQFVLHGIVYAVAVVVLAWLAPRIALAAEYVALVIAITILQHAALELYRVLVRLHRVMAASLAFFVRDAGWIPFCLLQWWLVGSIDLRAILWYWLAGSVASVLFLLWRLGGATPPGQGGNVDWRRLRRGLGIGLGMLPGTLSLRSFFSLDRMLLALWVLPDTLGAYVFYTGVCAAFHGLFESGVLPFYWPQLLEAEKRGDATAIAQARRNLTRICWLFPLGVALASLLVGFVAGRWLENPVYAENLDLLGMLVVAYALLGVNNAPHYRLYTKGRDLQIVASHILGLAIFVGSAFLVSWLDARLAVPMGLALGGGAILLIKTVLAGRIEKDWHPPGTEG